MPPGAYLKPPITEAVINLQFLDELDVDALAKLRIEFADAYPGNEPNFELLINVNVNRDGLTANAKATAKLGGFKLSSSDQLDLIILNRKDLSCSRLAPYLGWQDIFGKAKRNFEIFRKAVGYRNLGRLAVRYINRLDIPIAHGERLDPTLYLLNIPLFPGQEPIAFDGFNAQVIFAMPELRGGARVATAGVPSPLIDHLSVMLDIDIYSLEELPNRPDDIYEVLEKLHKAKNDIFESCITQRARELF